MSLIRDFFRTFELFTSLSHDLQECQVKMWVKNFFVNEFLCDAIACAEEETEISSSNRTFCGLSSANCLLSSTHTFYVNLMKVQYNLPITKCSRIKTVYY